MTREDQVRAIHALGYTESEAKFLRIVALHSGYFVRRQFLRFTESAPGKRAQDFIDGLIARRHAKREIFRGDRHLFRLQSKTIYEALGQDDNRNRRERQPSTVRLRLMGLDFILEHPDYQFLLSERQRLEHFLDRRGIDVGMLPARLFRSHGTVTARFFPDGFAQFLPSDASQAMSFVYVDDTQLSLDAFSAYLRNYRRLFEQLRAIDLVFLTTAGSRFSVAQKALERFRTRSWETNPPRFDLNRLLAHFPHRLLFERRSTGSLNTAQMKALAEDIHAVCGAKIDALYEVWKQGDVDALKTEWGRLQQPAPPQINLVSSILKYDYDLFGSLHAAS
jgi:hypothetical protein